jgi:hypothetical protein
LLIENWKAVAKTGRRLKEKIGDAIDRKRDETAWKERKVERIKDEDTWVRGNKKKTKVCISLREILILIGKLFGHLDSSQTSLQALYVMKHTKFLITFLAVF